MFSFYILQHPLYEILRKDKTFRGVITDVEIVMKNARGCEKYPHHEMDEHCTAHIQ